MDVRDSSSSHAVTRGHDRVSRHTTTQPGQRHSYAVVAYDDDYVQAIILSAMRRILPADSLTLLDAPTSPSPSDVISLAVLLHSVQAADRDTRMLQITAYERIDFDYALSHPRTCLVNSYVIRKALIRKHFLSATVDNWVAKNPDSALRTHVKRSEAFELDYAEFLDDALVEAFDLRASLEKNAALEKGPTSREGCELAKEYWILKPGMSDRGQGIRLFSTMEELQGIFDGWDADMSDSEDDDEDDEEGAARVTDHGSGRDYIKTSHLRHFVAQPYIDPPLLVDNRKFHVRTYVLALGRLRVYVYRDMLALFAASMYLSPSDVSSAGPDRAHDLDAHLTNTCLTSDSTGGEIPGDAVRRFWDLTLPEPGRADAVFTEICAVTGELFEAAARGTVVHFQPLEQAFEVFGLDFLVDAAGTAWLLEVNAFPDFKQTGGRLRGVVAGFWDAVLRLAVAPFLAGADACVDGPDDMVMVKELHLGTC